MREHLAILQEYMNYFHKITLIFQDFSQFIAYFFSVRQAAGARCLWTESPAAAMFLIEHDPSGKAVSIPAFAGTCFSGSCSERASPAHPLPGPVSRGRAALPLAANAGDMQPAAQAGAGTARGARPIDLPCIHPHRMPPAPISVTRIIENKGEQNKAETWPPESLPLEARPRACLPRSASVEGAHIWSMIR